MFFARVSRGNDDTDGFLIESLEAAMPLQIFNYAISPYDDWHRQAWAGALVLLIIVTLINVSVRVLTKERFREA